MKKIVLATPRSGSHAYCDLQENNLSECMNIEDMLLPRLDNEQIDFSVCSDVFLDALNDLNFITAWCNRPKITQQHRMYTFDDNMNKISITEQPTLDAVVNEHYRRWRIIKNMDSWCVKLIKYQGTPQNVIDQMLDQADEVVILKRRDRLAQALSMTKATQSQLWHGNNLTGDAGDIDYDVFKRSVTDVFNNENWIDQYDGTTVYYEDLDLTSSSFNKNNILLNYDLERCNDIMNATNEPEDFKTWFNNFINTSDFTNAYQHNDSGYLKSITSAGTDYWDVHIAGLELASNNMSLLDKNAKILDIGTWFGVMPYALKQYGFNNVSTTECAEHSNGIPGLRELWNDFDIDPFELHILPKKRFELPDTYDLITIFRSNVFWKTQEVLHHTPGNTVANDTWQIQDQDGVNHTFFTVYNRSEWELFIENIKEFLNPGGVAVIQPSPYVYDKIESFKEELDFLAPYCHPGPIYDAASDHRAFYIVIRK